MIKWCVLLSRTRVRESIKWIITQGVNVHNLELAENYVFFHKHGYKGSELIKD